MLSFKCGFTRILHTYMLHNPYIRMLCICRVYLDLGVYSTGTPAYFRPLFLLSAAPVQLILANCYTGIAGFRHLLHRYSGFLANCYTGVADFMRFATPVQQMRNATPVQQT